MTARGPGRPAARGTGAADAPRGASFPKAALLIAAGAALGVYLLQLAPAHLGGAPPASGAQTPPATSPPTTSTPATGATTTTSTTQAQGAPTGSVKVLVANASQTNGVATYYTDQLGSHGWGTLTPLTALTAETTSSVYYAPGDEPYAATVASELGVSSPLQPISATTPVTGATAAQVVVVVGNDLAATAHPAG